MGRKAYLESVPSPKEELEGAKRTRVVGPVVRGGEVQILLIDGVATAIEVAEGKQVLSVKRSEQRQALSSRLGPSDLLVLRRR